MVLIALFFSAPAASAFADEGATPPQTAPMAFSPEETAALQSAAPESENASVVDDASNFISDNAPFFIIGIIVLAAILAGILIMRGRRRKGSGKSGSPAPSAAGTGLETKAVAVGATKAGAPASVPSATELRRRKRAAMQRAREEERLRRRAGKGAGKAAGVASAPPSAVSPVEAEKQAARDQAKAAGAVGRVGTTITPPASGQPAPPPSAQTVPGGVAPVSSSAFETPTAVNPLPGADGEDILAPAPDAAVGRAAAAFAAGGLVAGQVGRSESQDALQAKVEEIKAAQGSAAPVIPDRPDPSQPAPPVITGLSAVERQLSADSAERDRTLKAAEERLQEIERRAEDAERRAAFAERLARLKLEESERERRLDDVMSGIDRAEERAREAEKRAEAAERAAAAALEQGSNRRQSADFADPTAQSSVTKAPASPSPAPRAPAGSLSGGLNLNSATFEELREAELSVTQATRILAYRERFGGYASIDDLEKVPGFPSDTVDSLRGRFTV